MRNTFAPQFHLKRPHQVLCALSSIVALVCFSPPDADAAKRSRRNVGAVDYVILTPGRPLSERQREELQSFFAKRQVHLEGVRQGTLDLAQVMRNESVVQRASPGQGFPLVTTALKPVVARASLGSRASSVLARGDVVMSITSAKLRKARVGDRVTLIGWNGIRRNAALGAIIPDDHLVSAELAIPMDLATKLEFGRPIGLRAWGFSSRPQLETTLQILKRTWSGPAIRMRYSWTKRHGGPVSQVRMKTLLGEFSVQRLANGALVIDEAWMKRNVDVVDLPIIGPIRCNKTVGAAASKALQELKAAGLAKLINIADTRGSGGCFNARTSRSASGRAGQTLSRHAWGAAIDINPTRNRYGGTSHMDQRVILAFGRHGFTWGGHFSTPDPMHFEYVG